MSQNNAAIGFPSEQWTLMFIGRLLFSYQHELSCCTCLLQPSLCSEYLRPQISFPSCGPSSHSIQAWVSVLHCSSECLRFLITRFLFCFIFLPCFIQVVPLPSPVTKVQGLSLIFPDNTEWFRAFSSFISILWQFHADYWISSQWGFLCTPWPWIPNALSINWNSFPFFPPTVLALSVGLISP